MKIERPRFELTRVYADGTSETPEIIPVGCMPWDTGMERRGFLGVGVGVASLLLLLDGCATANQKSNAPMIVPAKVLNAHKKSVRTLAISPDGKTLASGSADNALKLWSLPEGKLLATLEGHKKSVYALAISPDGEILASGDDAGVVILWNLAKRSFLSFLFDPKASQTDAITYNQYDQITGRTITFTLPCGSPIPPGAVCTCNCVPGTYRPPSSGGSRRGGGTYCTCNKVCTCIPVRSDRNAKEAFETIDPLSILQRLSQLPIQQWNYKWDDATIRHIGPMAQDFAEAFAVGEDDKHICPVDAQGVAFAAIQGLHRMIKEKETQTESLQAQLRQQQEENKALNGRIEALETLAKAVLERQV